MRIHPLCVDQQVRHFTGTFKISRILSGVCGVGRLKCGYGRLQILQFCKLEMVGS